MRAQFLLLTWSVLLVVVAHPAYAETIACHRWQHRLADVGEDAFLRAYIPDRGWVGIRLRGIDGPRLDGPCSQERLMAVLAKSKVMLELAQARTVAFCAPTETGGDVVEATVLLDGIELDQVLVEAGLAQPSAPTTRTNWCER